MTDLIHHLGIAAVVKQTYHTRGNNCSFQWLPAKMFVPDFVMILNFFPIQI